MTIGVLSIAHEGKTELSKDIHQAGLSAYCLHPTKGIRAKNLINNAPVCYHGTFISRLFDK